MKFYQWLIDQVQENLAKLADAIDRWVIAGLLVRGTHGTTELAARVLAPGPNWQPANVRFLVRRRHGRAFGFHVELIEKWIGC